MAETKYTPSSSGYTSSNVGWSTSTSTIIQGSSGTYTNYYGIVYFDFAAIRAKNANYYPARIRVRLKSHVSYARTIRLYVGQGMGKDTYAYGERPRAATGTSYKEASCAENGWAEFSITDPAWLFAMVVSTTTCLYINRGDSSASYWEGDGAEHATPPELYIDWISRAPKLTTPTMTAVGTIYGDSKTFDCSDSSDTSGYIKATDLCYELQFSIDGAAWRGPEGEPDQCYTSALGVSQISFPDADLGIPDLKAAWVLQTDPLQPAQYFYKTQCMVRMRSRTPAWTDGNVYRSAWATVPFVIDYRIPPDAPLSLTPSNPAPFEGENITLTVERPLDGTYNTHTQDGTPMPMTYTVELADGTALASGSSTAASGSVAIPYTVGNLTVDKADRLIEIRAKVTDGAQPPQVSPYTLGVQLTIRRLRAPTITVVGIDRTAEQAVVHIRVTDTGYAEQSEEKLADTWPVQYSFDDINYLNASLGEWQGLDNRFTVSGLQKTDRKTLFVKVTNAAPGSLTSSAYSDAIIEHLPSLFAWHRPVVNDPQAQFGAFAQAMIVGDDDDAEVNKGCAVIQNDIDVGGEIRKGGFAVAPMRWLAHKESSGSGWWKLLTFVPPINLSGATLEVSGYSNTPNLPGRGHWKLIITGEPGNNANYVFAQLIYSDIGIGPASFDLRYNAGVYALYFNIPQYTRYNIFCMPCEFGGYSPSVMPHNVAEDPAGTAIVVKAYISDFAKTLLDDATAAGVRDTLGAAATVDVVTNLYHRGFVAAFRQTDTSFSGAIQIKLPTLWSNDMIGFWVDVYGYGATRGFSVLVGGYTYAGGSQWVNFSASAQGGSVIIPVRFGYTADNKAAVWIMTNTQPWTYNCSVVVRDAWGSNSNDINGTWDLSIVSSYGSVQQTISDARV